MNEETGIKYGDVVSVEFMSPHGIMCIKGVYVLEQDDYALIRNDVEGTFHAINTRSHDLMQIRTLSTTERKLYERIQEEASSD